MMGYINFCSLPYTFRRNGTFYLYFRLPDNRFFKSSLACTEIKRARFLTSRLMFFISLLKLGRIENSQLQTIVRKMRQLESLRMIRHDNGIKSVLATNVDHQGAYNVSNLKDIHSKPAIQFTLRAIVKMVQEVASR
ncbi:Uncharacterised protein [Yersinia intermedia]|nr:Uncharacterised protein [Yersinia intermedia]CNC88473.1 Uncharacterised protein [Yersinia intermedia]